MAKHHKLEEIVAKLRQFKVLTAQGKSIAEAALSRREPESQHPPSSPMSGKRTDLNVCSWRIPLKRPLKRRSWADSVMSRRVGHDG